ncbi:MAG TPA: type II toxin-antitoxin system HicB family antitoxin [Candidatus Paceibacterota bacterium]
MKHKKTQYYISYEKDPQRGYIASAPSIPGCVVYGRTLKEAYKNIQVAIKECLEVIKELKKKTPKESITPDSVKRFSFVRM